MKNEVLKTAGKMTVLFGGIMALFLATHMYFTVGIEGALFGLLIGMMSGLLFGGIMYFFLSYKEGKIKEKETELGIDTEGIIFQGPANHFKGMEAVGGKLYLTETQLKFISHSFNIQNHELEIPLSEIEKVEKAKSIGLINNRLNVFTKDGNKEVFVLNFQQKWYNKLTSKA